MMNIKSVLLGAFVLSLCVTTGVALGVEASVPSAVIALGSPPEGDPPEGEPPDGYGGGTGGGSGGGTGETPPDKPGEGGTGGGGSGGASETNTLFGVLTFESVTTNLTGGTLTSTTTDENVILAKNGAVVTLSNFTLNKSGDCSCEDDSNFYAVNAVVAAKTNATVCIDKSTLNSNAKGANCLFASGEGCTIYAYDCTITSTKDSSRGLDATYEGTVIAANLDVDTTGDHCAAFATDRGNGSISVKGATMTTRGQGSPLIYSTGAIEVNGVTGTSWGAQIAGIEGLSTIRIKNSNLSGSGKQASEPVANGVIIYQSNSGDSTTGTATFEVSDSTLNSAITNSGALFYITHSEAVITVQNTELNFDTSQNYLLKAAGNNGDNGWGSAGSNGAGVVLTAINQTLRGDISVDGISSNDLYLVNSTYTGTFVKDTTYTGDGGANVFIDGDSTWTVTSNCTLKGLTAAEGASIVDSSERAVRIVDASGTELRAGTSDLEITVSSYVTEDFVATNITDFAISRTAFEAKYGESGSEEGESGGATDHDGWVYYCQPHPPDNTIVKVRVADATDYGTPDRDHKYCLDGYWDGTAEPGVVVHLLYVTTEGYLFADGCTTNTWDVTVTNNTQEIYPPEDVVAIKAQAKSGATFYRTLKEAVGAVKSRARIILNDDVTLEEPLTVTNSITLDLCGTNVLTLGSALTNALHFTAGGTVSNGTIRSTRTANAAGSVLMRFTDCKATLRNLTIDGRGYETVVAHDSTVDLAQKYETTRQSLDAVTCDGLILTGNGCLLSVDYAKATLTNNCSFTADGTLASFGDRHEAAVSCSGNGTVTIADGTYAAPKVLQSGDSGGLITVNGGTFGGQIRSWMSTSAHEELNDSANYRAQFALNAGTYEDAAVAFASADSFDLSAFTKGEDVALAVPAGYAWADNALVRDTITPGVTSDAYSDAQAATNAAAAINADKAGSIAVPSGVGDAFTTAYIGLLAATVTSDNRVVVDLTPAAEVEVQAAVDATVTNEVAFAALVSTNAAAMVTVTTTTPGLYYWIEGGTDVTAVTNAGAGVLSTDGGPVQLAKPSLDATTGQAFFKVAAGVASPAASSDD